MVFGIVSVRVTVVKFFDFVPSIIFTILSIGYPGDSNGNKKDNDDCPNHKRELGQGLATFLAARVAVFAAGALMSFFA